MEINEIIGKNIRYYRKKVGLLQKQLGRLALNYNRDSEKAGQEAISKFETLREEPSASELYYIAESLNTKVEMFFDIKTARLIKIKKRRQRKVGIKKNSLVK